MFLFEARLSLPNTAHLGSQVAGDSRPLYPKVDHYWFKVAHNYEPLALQARKTLVRAHKLSGNSAPSSTRQPPEVEGSEAKGSRGEVPGSSQA